MSRPPGKYRRDGREAFEPGGNPEDYWPHKRGGWMEEYHMGDFIDGWNEAKEDAENEKAWKEPVVQEYPETHQDGMLLVEKSLEQGAYKGDVGLQVAGDGRIWVCFDGVALLRFSPAGRL